MNINRRKSINKGKLKMKSKTLIIKRYFEQTFATRNHKIFKSIEKKDFLIKIKLENGCIIKETIS